MREVCGTPAEQDRSSRSKERYITVCVSIPVLIGV